MDDIDKVTWGGLNADDRRFYNIAVYSLTLPTIAAAIYWWPETQTIHFVLFALMWVLTQFGISIGYHRYFTHRSFKCKPWFAYLLMILGTMSLTGGLLQWVRTHRAHHRFVDKPGDPHSPIAGPYKNIILNFFHSHFLWLLTNFQPNTELDAADRRLLEKVSHSSVAWKPMPYFVVVLLGMLIPGIIAGFVTQTWSGALLGILWGGLLRSVFMRNGEVSVNSICHVFGQKTYETDDNSRDNWFCAIIALGEGWHNTHHKFPYSARQGLKWWQIDLSYCVIYSFEKFDVIWDVKLPAKSQLRNNADA